MKLLSRNVLLSIACGAGCLVATGCVSQKTIDTYEVKLKALEAKGVPDSILSSVRVYLSQAKSGRQSGNSMITGASIDSVKRYITSAELWYDNSLRTAKPHVDSLLAYFAGKKKGLSGMQLKQADSLLTIIDSYVKSTWYLQAMECADQLDSLLPTLLSDETSAGKAGAKIIGSWSMTHALKDDGANAMEKKKVTFKKDGTFSMNEEMKGLTKPTLKEDWQFLTQGTYAIKGDTILLSVNHEKRVREIYWNFIEKKGSKTWVKSEKKPSDSAITNGSKDRFFTFSYLQDNFKK
jgi:hypothetical protein